LKFGFFKTKENEIKMNDLILGWFDCLDCHSRLNATGVVKKGLFAPIAIKEEKKAGKTVTTVEGLQRFGIDAEAFASECAKLFASSANVGDKGSLHVQVCLTTKKGRYLFILLNRVVVFPKLQR
jgi:translation initiation factor 1 (eIF-1/SUI1)